MKIATGGAVGKTRRSATTRRLAKQVNIIRQEKESKSVARTKQTRATTRALRAEEKDTRSKSAGSRNSKAVAKVKEKAEAKERAKVMRRTKRDGKPVPRDRKPQYPGNR